MGKKQKKQKTNSESVTLIQVVDWGNFISGEGDAIPIGMPVYKTDIPQYVNALCAYLEHGCNGSWNTVETLLLECLSDLLAHADDSAEMMTAREFVAAYQAAE